MELANIQRPRKGDFRAGVEIHKNSRGSKSFRSISLYFSPTILGAFYIFNKVSFFSSLSSTTGV